MEKIEITAKFKRDGSLIPIEFLFEDQSIQILDVGRQWETEDFPAAGPELVPGPGYQTAG